MIDFMSILQGLTMIVAGATVLARLTKTGKDDSFLEKARLFLEKISNMFLPDRK